jgi:hypothetical protein
MPLESLPSRVAEAKTMTYELKDSSLDERVKSVGLSCRGKDDDA